MKQLVTGYTVTLSSDYIDFKVIRTIEHISSFSSLRLIAVAMIKDLRNQDGKGLKWHSIFIVDSLRVEHHDRRGISYIGKSFQRKPEH